MCECVCVGGLVHQALRVGLGVHLSNFKGLISPWGYMGGGDCTLCGRLIMGLNAVLQILVIGPFQGTNMILYYAFKFPGNIHKSALDFHVEHPYF